MGKCTLTKKLQAQIVEILEAGNYQKTAFESLGIPERTYYNWIQEGEKAQSKASKLTKTEEICLQFVQSIKRAVQVSRQANVKVIQDAGKAGSWQAAAWFLERTAFEEFGNKSKLEHSGKDGKAMKIIVEYEK